MEGNLLKVRAGGRGGAAWGWCLPAIRNRLPAQAPAGRTQQSSVTPRARTVCSSFPYQTPLGHCQRGFCTGACNRDDSPSSLVPLHVGHTAATHQVSPAMGDRRKVQWHQPVSLKSSSRHTQRLALHGHPADELHPWLPQAPTVRKGTTKEPALGAWVWVGGHPGTWPAWLPPDTLQG